MMEKKETDIQRRLRIAKAVKGYLLDFEDPDSEIWADILEMMLVELGKLDS